MRDRSEAISKTMELGGGFAVIGAAVAAGVAAVGEAVEITTVSDSFPGGTLVKAAAGLGVAAAALISGSAYFDRS